MHLALFLFSAGDARELLTMLTGLYYANRLKELGITTRTISPAFTSSCYDVWRYLESAMWIARGLRRVADRSAAPQRDDNASVRDEHRHDGQQVDDHVEERRVGDR